MKTCFFTIAFLLSTAALGGYNPTASPTDINGSIGPKSFWYSYSPTIAQTSPTTRYVYYCGYARAGDVGPIHDHVMMTVGTLAGGVWKYSNPVVAFGPDGAPQFTSFHTCDPSLAGGHFGWNGHMFSWAIFFSATGTGTGQNQVGVAFSDSLTGPWHIFPKPVISEEMEFGNNSSTWPKWGLGHPSAISNGQGKILLFYKLGTGPEVARTIDLSNIASPQFLKRVVISTNGLPPIPGTTGASFHAGEFAYDASHKVFLTSLDVGPFIGPAKVQTHIAVAVLNQEQLLSGTGTWQILRIFGKDLSGHTNNSNSGIIRDLQGNLPDPRHLGVLFTVADPSITHGTRNVFENRLWDAEGDLN